MYRMEQAHTNCADKLTVAYRLRTTYHSLSGQINFSEVKFD
jgi:hypothetical protein